MKDAIGNQLKDGCLYGYSVMQNGSLSLHLCRQVCWIDAKRLRPNPARTRGFGIE